MSEILGVKEYQSLIFKHLCEVWIGMNLSGWKFRVVELDLYWTWDGMVIAALLCMAVVCE